MTGRGDGLSGYSLCGPDRGLLLGSPSSGSNPKLAYSLGWPEYGRGILFPSGVMVRIGYFCNSFGVVILSTGVPDVGRPLSGDWVRGRSSRLDISLAVSSALGREGYWMSDPLYPESLGALIEGEPGTGLV